MKKQMFVITLVVLAPDMNAAEDIRDFIDDAVQDGRFPSCVCGGAAIKAANPS